MAWIVERPNGKCLVQWREPGGLKRSRTVATPEEATTLKEHVEAEARARRVLRDVPGIPGWDNEDDPATLAAIEREYALETYLRRIIEQDSELRESVRNTYLGTVRRIEGTQLGKADIRTITPDDVQTFWNTVERNRRSVYQMLAKAFNAAVRAGIIDSSPIFRAGIKKPRARIRPEDRVLSVAELERLASGATHPRGRTAILLMGFCGLRAGEVAGLRIQDVAFRPRCRLSIRQAVVEADGRRYISQPKTAAARRTISVPESIIDELRALADEHPPAEDGRLFHRDGGLIGNSSLNAQVKWAAKRAGLPPVHSHQLRHTAVSLLIDANANAKQIQAYVGHANITETLQTYGHLLDQAGDALAVSMEARREAHRNGG